MRGKSRLFCIQAVIAMFFLGMFNFGQEDLAREETELFSKYQSLNNDFEKGKMYFGRQDFGKAKKEFEKILEKLPEHADAHFFLSQILYKEGNLEEALIHVEKAKVNHTLSAKMKMRLAQVSQQKLEEKRKKLEDELKKLEEEIIGLPQTSETGEEGESRKKRIQSKIDEIKTQIANINTQLNLPLSFEQEIPAEYCYLKGNIYFRMKKFQEAHDQYQETIRLDPKYGDAYNNLAALYFQVKQYQKAMDFLNQAEENGAKINPEFKEALRKALKKD